MRSVARLARRRQRGQVIPILAIATLALVSFVALAADLSVNTHQRRVDQNITDSAALAGAFELHHPASSTYHTEQVNAATEAVKVAHKYLPWSTSSATYASDIVNASPACPAGVSYCDVSFQLPSPYGTYTLTVNTPPTPARGYDPGAYSGVSTYVQVILEQQAANQFAAFVGGGKEAAQSVAYHIGPNEPFGFALYTNSYATTGNASELIQGNVYAYRNIYPQSNGQADLCSTGAIVLGLPQYPSAYPNPDPAAGQPFQYLLTHGNVLQQANATCSNISGGGQVAEAQTLNTCPGSVNGIDVSGQPVDTLYTHACLATIPAPSYAGPANPPPTNNFCAATGNSGLVSGFYQPGTYSCPGGGTALVADHPLAAGVFRIIGNGSGADVTLGTAFGNCGTLTGYTFCMQNVTFDLENSAAITDNGGTGLITPFSNNLPVYGPPSSTSSLVVSKNGTALFMQGTVYMVNGSVNIGQNAHVSIRGQAIVGSWTVQSGNHQNPDITYDGSVVTPVRETLELVK